MDESYLYHYTSIENLALILKNRTIRFKPLNTLDDLLEGICIDGFELRKNVFVSCWTEIEPESIPFWNMYTPNMSGVRIRMRKQMFTDRLVRIVESGLQDSVQTSILDEEQHVKPDYFIAPTHTNYLQKVIYTDSNELLFPKVYDEKGQVNYDPVGKYKKTEWEFQKEWRYIIRAWPRMHGLNFTENVFFKEIGDGIFHKVDLPFSFIDVSISEVAFNDMVVMLGPKTTEAQHKIVESLKKYNGSLIIEESQIKVR